MYEDDHQNRQKGWVIKQEEYQRQLMKIDVYALCKIIGTRRSIEKSMSVTDLFVTHNDLFPFFVNHINLLTVIHL